MIAHVAVHWLKAERREQALQRIIKAGEDQRTQPGLVDRRVMVSESDPLKVTSLSIWRSQADVDVWRKHPLYLAGREGLGDNWSRPTEHEYFEVVEP